MTKEELKQQILEWSSYLPEVKVASIDVLVDNIWNSGLVEHCAEPSCPECNMAAYKAGQEAERERLVNEFTKLKEKSETVRDQLYLDGVITVITDGDTEKYIKE